LHLELLEARDVPAPLAWAAGTPLPTATGGLALVQNSAGATVVLGGSSGAIAVPSFAAANPAWQASYTYNTPLDQGRNALGAGVLADSTILIFGGQGAEGDPLNTAYDFYGNPGAPASMSTERYQMGYATDENHLVYAIGGRNADGSPLSSAEVFNQAANTWTRLASMPQGLVGLSAAADDAGHVFVFGGTNGSGHLSAAVYRYTIASNTWDTVASLPVATTNSAAVLGSDGLLYVLGGITSAGTTANVESYNESTNTWTTETPLPAPVSSAGATSDSLGRIVVAGGFDANSFATGSVSVSQELNQPDAAPVITTASLAPATVGLAYSQGITSTGNPQPTYALTAAPTGMTIDSNTGIFSWTPTPDQVGSQSVTVQASNYAGTATQTYSMYVLPAAPTGLTANGSSASTIDLSWNAVYDPGGVTYSVTEEKWVSNGGGKGSHGGHWVYTTVGSGITDSSYTVGGLPTGSSHSYFVTAQDTTTGYSTGRSNVASAQTWYPPSFPQAPAFLLSNGALWSGPVNVTENMTVQIKLLGVGNPLTYSVQSGQSTVSVDPVSGVVTYTPTASEQGQVNITFEASNPLGTATQTVTFNVLPPATILFSDGPFTFNGYPFYASATAVGSDGVTPVNGSITLSYSGPSNPPSFAGTYTVTAYFTSNDPNYGDTMATGTMIINPATVYFTSLKSPLIPVGKPSVTLSGYLTNGTLAPASGTIDVTLNGVMKAVPLQSGDYFAATFTTSGLVAGAYSVSYDYVPGDTDFTAPTGHSTLRVGSLPRITTQPTAQTVVAGTSVTFTAAATGNPAPTVQWQVSTNGGGTFSDIQGATSTTLTITATTTENHDKYRAVFTNALGSTATTGAVLTVDWAPVVTTNPTSKTVTSGNTVTFKAAASGYPRPTVQWQVSTDGGQTFTDIQGATSTTLSFVVSTSENGYKYQAVFTNALGTATTTVATLTVPMAPAAPLQPNRSVPAGPPQFLLAIARPEGDAVETLFGNVVASSLRAPAPAQQHGVSVVLISPDTRRGNAAQTDSLRLAAAEPSTSSASWQVGLAGLPIDSDLAGPTRSARVS
jgi:hypothetical protein